MSFTNLFSQLEIVLGGLPRPENTGAVYVSPKERVAPPQDPSSRFPAGANPNNSNLYDELRKAEAKIKEIEAQIEEVNQEEARRKPPVPIIDFSDIFRRPINSFNSFILPEEPPPYDFDLRRFALQNELNEWREYRQYILEKIKQKEREMAARTLPRLRGAYSSAPTVRNTRRSATVLPFVNPRRSVGVSGFGDFIFDIPILGDVLGGALGRETSSDFFGGLGRLGGQIGTAWVLSEIMGGRGPATGPAGNFGGYNPYWNYGVPAATPVSPAPVVPSVTPSGESSNTVMWMAGGLAALLVLILVLKK